MTVLEPDANEQSSFPSAIWSELRAEFYRAASILDVPAPIRAVVVFARRETGFLLADITKRGWCTPSGRLEPGETPEEAARRETWEETGATLGPLTLLGYYQLTRIASGDTTYAPAYAADVLEIGPIPEGSESRAICVTAPEDLPAVYYTWDALIEAVFRYALRVR